MDKTFGPWLKAGNEGPRELWVTRILFFPRAGLFFAYLFSTMDPEVVPEFSPTQLERLSNMNVSGVINPNSEAVNPSTTL